MYNIFLLSIIPSCDDHDIEHFNSLYISYCVSLNLLYSYIKYNARSLDHVKAYAKHVPSFLKNRPKMFVDHCITRIPPFTRLILEETIRQTLMRKFQVRNFIFTLLLWIICYYARLSKLEFQYKYYTSCVLLQ